ncbi:MAG TPA: branched-chain amino acid ABC transporter permease/ATP-binding protein [Frankiaceae bacterium]|nr:branched-chain amino acid ABC transporter permease/ATP-binding protein [Frankiaceae bacterium]
MLDVLVYLLLTLPLMGAYAMLALGIVVIFRASKVLNLAHGAMAMAPAYLVYSMSEAGIPVGMALLLGIASGALLGAATERFFVRPLRRQGPTAQTVGTVAVFGLVVSVVAKVYGTTPLTGPRLFPAGGVKLQGSVLQWGNIGLFLTAALVALGFVALFRFTNLGLALRGAADNRTAAALVGVNPDRAALVAWLIGGGLAGFAGILLGGVTSLSPYSLSLQMLPAFVAALMGGLGSLGGAMAGAVLVGGLTGLVPAFGLIESTRRLTSQLGMSQLILTIVALVVMYTRGGRYSATDVRAESAGSTEGGSGRKRYDVSTQPRASRHRVRNYTVLVALLVWPFVGNPFTLLGDAVQASLYVIAAASIVLLTGWVGQISLAQAAFVGIGGYGSALVINELGLPFPANLIAGAVIAALAAAALGVVALRVRGLYLAVATLIFAYMADSYLFVAPWFAGSGGVSIVEAKPIGRPDVFPFFDLSDRRTFYYVALAVAATVLFALANLRDSKTGRAFFAIRGSETAAASLGIDVRRYKLLAFALAGGIAGLAGNLQLVSKSSIVSTDFAISMSLLFLAIAVVGGLQSLEGLVASAILFAGLNELFYRVSALSGYLEVTSAGLLAVVLLVYPGGLAQLPATVRRLLRTERLRTVGEQLARARARAGEGLAARRTAPASAEGRARVPSAGEAPRRARLAEPLLLPLTAKATAPVAAAAPAPVVTTESLGVDLARLGDDAGVPPGIVPMGVPVLEARDIRVEFDGLVAVDNASLKLHEGQIVGLIGPNGAGKTTLFNAVSGLVRPTSGTVHLFGDDVTDLDVHVRARRGLGRTFQAIQLFPQLTVYENLLVATHANNDSGLFSHVALTRRGLRHEAAAEDVVRRVVAAMGLEAVADRTVAGLPFGVLRQVEIARTVVTGSPVVMLDEPASGLDNAETDRLSDLLYGLRDRLGLTLLLIEHDVRMVTEVSDYMYVLVYGKIVAAGTPDEVRNDPVVTAAYLGEPTGAEAETGTATSELVSV